MNANKNNQAGLTLVEILISLIVLSVGLLGIAGMQATGLSNNHAAYSKMQATNLAMDMADRIRSNPNAIATYGGFDSSDPNTVPANSPGCISSSNGCSAANLATTDLYQWSAPLLSGTTPILPDGKATITVNGTAVAITLYWREPGFGNINMQSCEQAQAADIACFQMSFTL